MTRILRAVDAGQTRNVKTAFAILLSILLALTQSFVAFGAAGQSAVCSYCNCENRCCVGQSSPNSQALPTAPARAKSSRAIGSCAAASAFRKLRGPSLIGRSSQHFTAFGFGVGSNSTTVKGMGCQVSGVRSQKSEVRSQRSEVRGQKLVDGVV